MRFKEALDNTPLTVAPESREVRHPSEEGFFTRLFRSFSIPRPAIAATAIAIILVGVYFFNPTPDNGVELYADSDSEVTSILALYSYGETNINAQNLNLGTSIEEYFL